MLNVNELENRWRKYKIKSYIPYIIITLSIITIITLTYYITNTKEKDISLDVITKDNTMKVNEDIFIASQVEKQKDIKIIKNVVVQTTINPNTNDKSVVLTPSLGFMSNLKHGNIYNEDVITPSYNNPAPKKTELIIEEPEEIEEETIQEPKAVKKSSIKIDRNNSQDDLEYVIQRFKKSNNPALSLFIAKKYYSLGEYHKSYNYALITNELNGKIDASWIIFSKSLVKLNEKEEAIKTLKKYVEHSHSTQAKILLDDIVSGDFK